MRRTYSLLFPSEREDYWTEADVILHHYEEEEKDTDTERRIVEFSNSRNMPMVVLPQSDKVELRTSSRAISRRDAIVLGTAMITVGYYYNGGCCSCSTKNAAAHASLLLRLREDEQIDEEDVAAAAAGCQKGILVDEVAIPGAYQHACMNLAQRIIPITLPVVDHHGRVECEYLIVEQQRSGPGSTGLAVWNSSLVLSRLLQRLAILSEQINHTTNNISSSSSHNNNNNNHWFRSLGTVMELGCGVGVASMTCALIIHALENSNNHQQPQPQTQQSQPLSRILATDGNPNVVELAHKNVHINHLSDQVSVAALSWGLLNAIDYSESADLVIGADLTYSPGSWRNLAETMSTVLKQNGVILYLSMGHAGFNVDAEVDGFLAVALEQGLVDFSHSSSLSSSVWPFPSSSWAASSRSLSRYLLQDCILPQERAIVESNGGIRVLLLTHRRSHTASVQ